MPIRSLTLSFPLLFTGEPAGSGPDDQHHHQYHGSGGGSGGIAGRNSITSSAAPPPAASAATTLPRDSAIISFAPRRYTRDQLLELRCSTLVRRRPRYVEEAIAARKSWCRHPDLVAAATATGFGDDSAAAGGSGGGMTVRQQQQQKRSENAGDVNIAGGVGSDGGGMGLDGRAKRGGGVSTTAGKAVGLSRFVRSSLTVVDGPDAGSTGGEKGGSKSGICVSGGGASSGGGPRRSMTGLVTGELLYYIIKGTNIKRIPISQRSRHPSQRWRLWLGAQQWLRRHCIGPAHRQWPHCSSRYALGQGSGWWRWLR